MNIKWYGHSAFLITTGNGTRIILDPYQSGAFGGALAYGKISEAADIVLRAMITMIIIMSGISREILN